jgi:hypothetical protein
MASRESALDFCHMMETLTDERFGLYFLAGVDTEDPATDTGMVTIHAAEGALTPEHQYFIESTFADLYPGYDVRFRIHSNRDLHAPDSLESFARNFQHDHIVADPTGAFARVSHLLELARQIRAELGTLIDRILWQADASALVVLAAPFKAGGSPSGEKDSFDRLCNKLNSLVENRAPADLRNAIRSVRLSQEIPSGRYTPIDGGEPLAVPVPAPKSRFTGMLARISGIAALVGLGTISAASASATGVIEDDQHQMPGITGLIGLTTLGENSYGLRNRYQAVGGLRLYFGETGALMTLALMPGPECADDCQSFGEPGIDAPEQSDPTWPMPSRLAYGT